VPHCGEGTRGEGGVCVCEGAYMWGGGVKGGSVWGPHGGLHGLRQSRLGQVGQSTPPTKAGWQRASGGHSAPCRTQALAGSGRAGPPWP
jgi:hypothetical protein